MEKQVYFKRKSLFVFDLYSLFNMFSCSYILNIILYSATKYNELPITDYSDFEQIPVGFWYEGKKFFRGALLFCNITTLDPTRPP